MAVFSGAVAGCDDPTRVTNTAVHGTTSTDDSAVVDNCAATHIETAINQQSPVTGFGEGVVVQVQPVDHFQLGSVDQSDSRIGQDTDRSLKLMVARSDSNRWCDGRCCRGDDKIHSAAPGDDITGRVVELDAVQGTRQIGKYGRCGGYGVTEDDLLVTKKRTCTITGN